MDRQRRPLIEVYRSMLARAQALREEDKRMQEKYSDQYDGAYEGLAQEVYYWIKELENTEEINPTK